jgi:hypothetical protein
MVICVRVAGSLFCFFFLWCIRNCGGCHQPTIQFRCFPFLLYNLGWGIFDKFRPGKEIEIAGKPLL